MSKRHWNKRESEIILKAKQEVFDDILDLKNIELEVLTNNISDFTTRMNIQSIWLLGYADFYNEVLKIKKKHLGDDEK